MSSLAPHICVLHSCAMCGHLFLGPVGEPIDPPTDIVDNEVHEMHHALDVTTGTGGCPRESSHSIGEEVPSSYTNDVVVRVVFSQCILF